MIMWRRAGAPVLLVLLVVAGCRGSSASPPRSSLTGTPIPPESSTSAPPVVASPSPTLPAAAGRPTRDGAEAFATYFFAVYNYAFWSGNADALRVISDAKCVYCQSTIRRIVAMRSKGNHLDGGRIDVTTAVAAPGKPESGILVNLVLRQDASRTLSQSGEMVGTAAPVANGRMDLAVGWRGDRWLLLDAHVYKDGES